MPGQTVPEASQLVYILQPRVLCLFLTQLPFCSCFQTVAEGKEELYRFSFNLANRACSRALKLSYSKQRFFSSKQLRFQIVPLGK